ncbi:MAG: GumC family protein, partial [Acetobacteraceae bacterium]|nr:GumC family protein [Acetobacteraceae bacterium]
MLDTPPASIASLGHRLDSPGTGVSGRAMLAALRRRKWWLILTTLAVPALAFIAIRQVTPLYTASGTLIFEPSEYKVRELQSILRNDPATEAVLASQAEILRGLHIAERVAERGNLFNNPEFNHSLRPPSFWQRLFGRTPDPKPPIEPVYGPSPDDNRIATLRTVQAALDAHPVKFSRVLEVTFTSRDPLVAAAAVNNAMDVYVKDQYSAKTKAVDRATDLLYKRASELRRQVQEIEDRAAEKRASLGMAQGMHAGLDAEQISHLTEELVRARGDLANAEGKLDAARGRSGAAAQAAIAPSVVQLRAQQDQLTIQMQAQQGRLGSQHPEFTSLQRQLAEVQHAIAAEISRVVASSEAELGAARERVAALERNLQEAEASADKRAREQTPLNAMMRNLEASRQELQSVLERIQQTARQAEVESPEAHE